MKKLIEITSIFNKHYVIMFDDIINMFPKQEEYILTFKNHHKFMELDEQIVISKKEYKRIIQRLFEEGLI